MVSPVSQIFTVQSRRLWIDVIVCAGVMLQFCLTWPLWGFSSPVEFPVITMWGSPRTISGIDQLGSIMLVCSLIAGFILRRIDSRYQLLAWLGMSLSLITMICLSLQRFQPWLWHGYLVITALSLPQSSDENDNSETLMAETLASNQLRWIRRLATSIYFYSAISKFDAQFLTSQGNQLLDGLLAALDINAVFMSETTRQLLIFGFPCGELLVAFLLLFTRTRHYAMFAAATLHGGLLLTLGPWGLGHHLPVLLWNVMFLMITILCCTPSIVSDPASATNTQNSVLMRGVLSIALLFPALEWVGKADAWPAWGLYSARHGSSTIQVITNRDTSKSLLPFLRNTEDTEWKTLDYYRWSFAQTGAPAYPASRFSIGIGKALSRQKGIDCVRVLTTGPPDRWTGKSQSNEWTSPSD